MKQRVTIALLFLALSFLSAQQSQTGVVTYITDSGDTMSTTAAQRANPFPPPSPLACPTPNNLATPYNQNNGQRGIMFDITALNNITINCFDVNLAAGTTNTAIYYKVGTHVGFTTTPGAWTLIGSANATSVGNNLPSSVPVPVNVAVSAGCTVAFYITRTVAGGPVVNYTNGTAVGFVYAANADLQVKDGTGKDYPFGASFTPRRFNGTIYYTPTAGPGGGVVTGPTQVCAGASVQYVFTGTGWTSYNWTVPAGSVITAGQGTQTITVTAGATAGNICCTPSGPCGAGPVVCLAVSLAPAPTSVQSSTNVLCFGNSTGTATITASPVAVYTYTWSPNVGSTATVNNLPAGVYTVTATNSGGCSTTQTITITQPPSALTASQTQTDLACNGINNGQASVTPSGGTPGYTYAWTPSGGNASTATGLSAQSYTCTITDLNGCTNQQMFTLTAPTAITLATSSTPSTCGSPNGSATVVPAGGTGAYTYTWTPSGGTAATESNLTGGAYVVTVTDANGCTNQATVNVVGASTPSATITGSTNILCNGNTTGDATVTAAGGSGPYTYAWAPSGGNAATASNLGAASYTITVTDANNCTATATVTLTEPPALTAVISGTDILCNGVPTGSATITPSGGAGGNTFAWTPTGGNAATASGLSAQSYTCTVTDANGCTTSQSITLTEPPLLTTTFAQVDELCSGANNGSATVTPAGGAGGYTYSWAPSGGNASTAPNLFAGQYTCTITDANGCTLTQSFNITEPQTVILSQGAITNVDCFGNATGSAALNNNGGTLPYSYAWTPNASVTNSATALTAGNYAVVVTDANGCSASITLTVTEPPMLSVQASAAPNTICAGATVNLSANGGGGVQPYQFGWMPGPLVGPNQTVTPTATTTYTVGITDANGCTASTTTNVTVNPVPVAALTSDIVSGCAPVCINFSDNSSVAAPGVITAWEWDFGDGSPIDNTQNPQHCYTVPGQYTVILQVKTADGCIQTITMTNYINAWVVPIADFTAGPQPTTIFNPEIFFTDLSVNATQWIWSFGDVFGSSSTLQNPSFTYLEPNCYAVQLDVSTSNGCTDSASMEVCLDGDVAIYVPNAFTPNGNGTNEVFIPQCYGIDPMKYQFWVFDRWGNEIFTTTDINQGWDGTIGGTKCQIDTYVWRVYAWDILGNPHKLVGGFSLIR